MKLTTLFFFCLLSMGHCMFSADINPGLLVNRWDAYWITHPSANTTDYSVYHFRKEIELEAIPEKFIIHVSADNRYRLYVNRRSVSIGPSRWDLAHWRFESVDIAPFLQRGKNVIAAVVWNFGDFKPVAQLSWQTGFILQGNTEQEALLNTDESWKVIRNEAYEPIPVTPETIRQYIAVGPCEKINGAQYPWGWLKAEYSTELWERPKLIDRGKPRGWHNPNTCWMLTPRQIPPLQESLQRSAIIRRADGVEVHDGFLTGQKPLVIPANTKASILLDNTVLTTAYPEFLLSGGKETTLKLSYAEAMMTPDLLKVHRDKIEDLILRGYYDMWHLDGGDNRFYVPLWFRTYRYVQIDIETADDPLTIHDFYCFFTAYPFEEKASFASSDESLQQIWDVGWRTARLCAGETYFDCPYYEQLQYVGDTRIQALISLYVSGDDRLMRKAIQLFNDSRTPDGLTSSRYPTNLPQVIPPYSLFWVSMVYDYWTHRDDDDFIKSFLIGIEGVLDWYERRIDDTGMLGPMEHWNFVDWPDEWAWDVVEDIGGVPPGADDGNSSVITFQYIYVLKQAVQLFDAYGKTQVADHYRSLIATLKTAVARLCWDEGRQLYADTPEKNRFSQQGNITAVLIDLAPEGKEADFLWRVIHDTSLTQNTFYYQFYTFRALKKVGLADKYLELLQPWRDMLDLGLTTFAERPEPTRSDCHAWSASPNYDLLATVAGIEPASPGFRTVVIKPAFGHLEWIRATVPHPAGEIRVDLKRRGSRFLEGQVELPDQVTGTIIWQGNIMPLKSGIQHIRF
ncbi:alpha-L-rhamnosidase [candidate division KSB1 bacterium]|nr:alpha-L-rhamnosidase [candidate division KSB1 bacterium]RQW01580.1 MAG: alpha-L-rhamnosidase [candidate division KSB1 bacterium]